MNRRKPSSQEYSQFRECVEALSEKTRILRNHFYNHAFKDGTLLKVVEVRDVVDELICIAEHNASESLAREDARDNAPVSSDKS